MTECGWCGEPIAVHDRDLLVDCLDRLSSFTVDMLGDVVPDLDLGDEPWWRSWDDVDGPTYRKVFTQ